MTTGATTVIAYDPAAAAISLTGPSYSNTVTFDSGERPDAEFDNLGSGTYVATSLDGSGVMLSSMTFTVEAGPTVNLWIMTANPPFVPPSPQILYSQFSGISSVVPTTIFPQFEPNNIKPYYALYFSAQGTAQSLANPATPATLPTLSICPTGSTANCILNTSSTGSSFSQTIPGGPNIPPGNYTFTATDSDGITTTGSFIVGSMSATATPSGTCGYTLVDPQNPTEQQRQALLKARSLNGTIRSCEQMEAYAKGFNPANRQTDPGEIRVEGVNPPQFRQLLQSIPIGKPTEPLIARDGIAVITVCTREQKNVAAVTPTEIRNRLIAERVEMLSRQAMRELHRKASIDIRGGGV